MRIVTDKKETDGQAHIQTVRDFLHKTSVHCSGVRPIRRDPI